MAKIVARGAWKILGKTYFAGEEIPEATWNKIPPRNRTSLESIGRVIEGTPFEAKKHGLITVTNHKKDDDNG